MDRTYRIGNWSVRREPPRRFGWRAALFTVVAIGCVCVCQAAEMQEQSSPGAASRELMLSGDDWRIVSFEPGQGIEHRAFADGYGALKQEQLESGVTFATDSSQ